MNAKVLYLLVAVLFVLHQDFWFWDDATLVFGTVPIGFLYHIVYCFAAAGLMYALTRMAWPEHLEREVQASRAREERS